MTCRIFFTLDKCFMQENSMKKPSLLGKISNGLYYVQKNINIEPHTKPVQQSDCCNTSSA